MVGNLDFFVQYINTFFCFKHALNQVVVLVNLLFKLFNAVVAQFGIERNTAQRAAEGAEQAQQGDDDGFGQGNHLLKSVYASDQP